MARPSDTDAATVQVLVQLRDRGLLLQAGGEFPSVAHLVAGVPIKGSWWAHPEANRIYWVCEALADHPRVTDARLIAGKVTHVWDTLWADLAAVALARAPWQFARLDGAALQLLDQVDKGDVRTDALRWEGPHKLGDLCRRLEQRLLVKADEVHTASGRHAKQLTTWQRWWQQHENRPLPTAAHAHLHLEQLVGDSRLLPWAARRAAS